MNILILIIFQTTVFLFYDNFDKMQSFLQTQTHTTVDSFLFLHKPQEIFK